MKSSVYRNLLTKKFSYLLLLVLITLSILTIHLARTNKTIGSPFFDFQSQNFQSFRQFALKYDAELAYGSLKQQFPNNETDAHDFAHIIGSVSFTQHGLKGLKLCDTSYNYGCYHGFIESFLSGNSLEKVPQIETACTSLGTIHAPSCLHGIGHGLMADSSYQLDQALANCSLLRNDSQIYCWDGVFMERISGSMQTQDNKFIMTENNLHEPCNMLNDIYQKQCYRNQVSSWYRFFNADTQKIAAQCLNVRVNLQQICFESLGNLIALSAKNFDSIHKSCQVMPQDKYSDPCLMGTMDELMFEGKPPQIAKNLCSYVSNINKENCTLRFERLLNEYQVRFDSKKLLDK